MSAATKIYLSYAREDQEFAKRLGAALKAHRVTAWMGRVRRVRRLDRTYPEIPGILMRLASR